MKHTEFKYLSFYENIQAANEKFIDTSSSVRNRSLSRKAEQPLTNMKMSQGLI